MQSAEQLSTIDVCNQGVFLMGGGGTEGKMTRMGIRIHLQ